MVTGMGNLLQGSYIDVHEAARSGHIDEVRYVRNTYGIYTRYSRHVQEPRGRRW